MMLPFLDAGSNPDSEFIFYDSFFTLCFNQLKNSGGYVFFYVIKTCFECDLLF